MIGKTKPPAGARGRGEIPLKLLCLKYCSGPGCCPCQLATWAVPPTEESPFNVHCELVLSGHNDRPLFLQILALEGLTPGWFYFLRGFATFLSLSTLVSRLPNGLYSITLERFLSFGELNFLALGIDSL